MARRRSSHPDCNDQQWWKGDNATRYDYEYRPDELEPWAQRIVDIAANTDVREVLAFFNNHAPGRRSRTPNSSKR